MNLCDGAQPFLLFPVGSWLLQASLMVIACRALQANPHVCYLWFIKPVRAFKVQALLSCPGRQHYLVLPTCHQDTKQAVELNGVPSVSSPQAGLVIAHGRLTHSNTHPESTTAVASTTSQPKATESSHSKAPPLFVSLGHCVSCIQLHSLPTRPRQEIQPLPLLLLSLSLFLSLAAAAAVLLWV